MICRNKNLSLQTFLSSVASRLFVHSGHGLKLVAHGLGIHTLHPHAARTLSTYPDKALPILHDIASRPQLGRKALEAACLLHFMGDVRSEALMHSLISSRPISHIGPIARCRHALMQVLGPEPFLKQIRQSLDALEKNSLSFRSLARFRHAAAIMRLLHAPLPPDLLKRALFTRAIGGEDLTLIRYTIASPTDVSSEHICQVRLEAIDLMLLTASADDSLALLLSALKHPNPALQLTALAGLAKLQDTRAIPALYSLSQNRQSPVREEARALLAQLDLPSSHTYLLLRAAIEPQFSTEYLLRTCGKISEAPQTLLNSSAVCEEIA